MSNRLINVAFAVVWITTPIPSVLSSFFYVTDDQNRHFGHNSPTIHHTLNPWQENELNTEIIVIWFFLQKV